MFNSLPFNWKFSNSQGVVVAGILVAALVSFEIFNFDTTKYALFNLMGGLRFVGLEWSAILAFAFCGIDLAGLIRLFTPEQGLDEPKEIWLLTGAWLIGASMNAAMTWYAIARAIAGRSLGTAFVAHEEIVFYAPIVVAVLVWLTRILFIGALSVAADRLLHRPEASAGASRRGRLRPSRTAVARQGARQSPNTAESLEDDLFAS